MGEKLKGGRVELGEGYKLRVKVGVNSNRVPTQVNSDYLFL